MGGGAAGAAAGPRRSQARGQRPDDGDPAAARVHAGLAAGAGPADAAGAGAGAAVDRRGLAAAAAAHRHRCAAADAGRLARRGRGTGPADGAAAAAAQRDRAWRLRACARGRPSGPAAVRRRRRRAGGDAGRSVHTGCGACGAGRRSGAGRHAAHRTSSKRPRRRRPSRHAGGRGPGAVAAGRRRRAAPRRRRRGRGVEIPSGPPPRALLVDDSELALRFLEVKLHRFGVQTERAVNSRRAIELLARGAYDLVFLDLELGDDSELDGLALCQHIRRHQAAAAALTSQVIIVSAHHGEADRVRGTLAGADAYLGKPLNDAELERLLVRQGLQPVAQDAATGSATA
ncbi:MAG: response regulator [Rubrivivax sp.]|nr:response regulator [Rubrivivax sp.]